MKKFDRSEKLLQHKLLNVVLTLQLKITLLKILH